MFCEARKQTNMIAPHVVERNKVYDDFDCLEIQTKFVSCQGVHNALLHYKLRYTQTRTNSGDASHGHV